MNFTAKETMYHGNRGLIQAGESIDFSEEEIKEFEPDYFKQLFSGNEDEVTKIFNPKSKSKDKEPGTETQPPETEPGDKNPPDENPPDENTEGDNTGNENPPDENTGNEKPKKTSKKKTDTTEE
nr:MAG TPA: hypothetical protein [Caudoviricetes sp.]